MLEPVLMAKEGPTKVQPQVPDWHMQKFAPSAGWGDRGALCGDGLTLMDGKILALMRERNRKLWKFVSLKERSELIWSHNLHP